LLVLRILLVLVGVGLTRSLDVGVVLEGGVETTHGRVVEVGVGVGGGVLVLVHLLLEEVGEVLLLAGELLLLLLLGELLLVLSVLLLLLHPREKNISEKDEYYIGICICYCWYYMP
jgi:hypothetical protein